MMATPHKCPVCGGTGWVWQAWSATEVLCRSCNGTGIVWERETKYVIQPIFRYDVHAS